jgi:predicted DNA-binding transcriptional regulator AlpA
MDSNEPCSFPKTGFVRLSQIIGNSKSKPPIPALIPVGRSTWWQWVKMGKAPAPIKLGPRTTAWRAEHILAFAERFQTNSESK